MPMLKRSTAILRILTVVLLVVMVTTGCGLESNRAHEGQEGVDDFPLEGMFAVSTGNIHDYMPDLLAGETVSGYDLLPCLENFTHTTWAELDEVYGCDWWDPLWMGLHDAAITQGQAPNDSSEQSLRNYYLGKALLASDGAYTEGLINIAMLQWNYDEALYSNCLSECFSEGEAATLRQIIIHSQELNSGAFALQIPEIGRAICLNAYPVDFPFGFDLVEKGREDFRAESFGPGTIVESDGLQVKYLNPSEGVYTVITIRATKKGYSTEGVAIGDPVEALLEQWDGKDLRKWDSISYDDQAWFGSQYDFAYIYTQESGTKSIVYLIRDGVICGIELTDGLDGTMY
ncbi:MAG TPA: hypothetical protein VFD15_05410 [Clostridia bacterium]|nr:hypothetical protein [Clostridia bacterium]